jgi:hypothetical protein
MSDLFTRGGSTLETITRKFLVFPKEHAEPQSNDATWGAARRTGLRFVYPTTKKLAMFPLRWQMLSTPGGILQYQEWKPCCYAYAFDPLFDETKCSRTRDS